MEFLWACVMKSEHTLEALGYRAGGFDDFSFVSVYGIFKFLPQTEKLGSKMVFTEFFPHLSDY